MVSNASTKAASRPVSASKKDLILHAAAEVFMERGYSATSINEIAERLNSTKGRIYYYYSSKAELFLDIHIAALRIIASRVEVAAQAEATPSRRLWVMAHAHAATIMAEFPVQKVAVQGLGQHLDETTDPSLDRIIRRVAVLRRHYQDTFVATIEAGVQSGEFRADLDPAVAAKSVLGSLNWLMVWFQPRRPRATSNDTLAAQLADFALAGLTGTIVR